MGICKAEIQKDHQIVYASAFINHTDGCTSKIYYLENTHLELEIFLDRRQINSPKESYTSTDYRAVDLMMLEKT